MCKRHTICEGQSHCIYVIDGVDCTAEGFAERFTPVPFTLSPLGEMALAITEAVPEIPLIHASKIAAHLDSIGYCVAPF